MPQTVPDLLAARVRRDPGSPLLTYYDLGSGERTELSGVTFANWVAKTANLISDELMLDAGDRVELALAATHPGHWITLVWEAACTQTGTTVTVGSAAAAQVVVAGPDWSGVELGSATLVACALHPLGLGFASPLPGGVVDFALEVRGQPDAFLGTACDPSELAWADDVRSLRGDELAVGDPEPARRRLVQPTTAWETTYAALVVPLRDGGSTVVVTGDPGPGQLELIRASERCD